LSEQTRNAEGWREQKEPEEVTALKPLFARLIVRQLDESRALTEGERRAADVEVYKAQMRAAFLSNPLATEQDFERLWPRLRDDSLCEHAVLTYGQVMAALSRDVDEGRLLHDYLGGADEVTAQPGSRHRAKAATEDGTAAGGAGDG
jgi:hypothetical protein